MSAKKNKAGTSWAFIDLFEDEAKEMGRDVMGSRVMINKYLAEAASINKEFLNYIDQKRKKLFDEIINDPDDNEYQTCKFDFEPDDFFVGKIITRILTTFQLPPNFRDWVCEWLNTGKKPTHLPLYDLDFLAKIEQYEKSPTGITANEKRIWKRWLRVFRKLKIIEKGEQKAYSRRIDNIPINKYRKKRISEDVLDYREQKAQSKSSSEIAWNYLEKSDPNSTDQDKATRLAAKLRKRDSLYNKKPKKRTN